VAAALAELRALSGSQFDADVVAAMAQVVEAVESPGWTVETVTSVTPDPRNA